MEKPSRGRPRRASGEAGHLKHEDPDNDPRWMNATIAVTGILFVLTVLLNFCSAISALFR